METKVNPEYQKLIGVIEGVLASSVFSQEMKHRLQIVKDGLIHLGSRPKLSDSVEQFMDITANMAKTYAAKNHDYGNSFEESLDEFGLVASVVRLGDKMNRIKSLIKKEARVKDESIKDTLLGLANYAIMTVMWLDGEKDLQAT